MALPINIHELIHGSTGEWECIALEEGWNPEVKPAENRRKTGGISEKGTKLELSEEQVQILFACQDDKAMAEFMHLAQRSNRTEFRDQVSIHLWSKAILRAQHQVN